MTGNRLFDAPVCGDVPLQVKEAQRRMAKLDLDALRAEADMTPHEVVLGGQTYRLRATMPLDCMALIKAGDLAEAMAMLLIDPGEWEQMRAAVPDDRDLLAVVALYS